MTKELTDAQMLRKLKRETKIIVMRHMDTMGQRDNLIAALEDIIAAFCPGPDWADTPVRKEADIAIINARRGIDG